MHNTDSLLSGAESLGISLSDKQVEQFLTYYDLLVEWNSFMNLTAITEYEDVIHKHFLDSISLSYGINQSSLNISVEGHLLDLGTGAGFPGIPLKIVYPDLQITLLDSLNKRVKFLNEVIQSLSLDGIKAVHGRAEEFAFSPNYRESFDIVVSRAVANMSTLSEYCLPFTKVNGFFIPYKSEKGEEELSSSKRAIHLLGGSVEGTSDFSLPGTNLYRCFYFIKKENTTSKKYPRKAGTPSKDPLH